MFHVAVTKFFGKLWAIMWVRSALKLNPRHTLVENKPIHDP